METESGRSSKVSERRHSIVEARSTPLSRTSRLGSAVDMILDRIGTVHEESMAIMQANLGAIRADTRDSIEAIHANTRAAQANLGAIHADTRDPIEAMHADTGALQVETREVLETVIHRLERLEASPAPKFVAGWI